MSTNPPPKGTILLYENVKIAITDGRISIEVVRHDGSEVGTVISQETGEVVGGANRPA